MGMFRTACLTGILLFTTTACADGSGSEPGGDPTAASEESTYLERGPHRVGVRTLTLERGPEVEVWYPATDDTDPNATDTYDVRDFTPELVRGLLTGDAPATFTITASRDASPGSGSHPVVLFSHGSSGMRVQSSFLTSHLASWGMVVIAPDHWSRDLPRALIGQTVGDSSDTPDDLFDALEATHEALPGLLDLSRIAVVGHSAGGGTALLAAADERIDGYVSMASGILQSNENFTMPDKPSFFMAGTLDEIVPANERTVPAFEAAPSPSLLWVLDGVGHNGFDDFCTFGNGTGIIGVAEASGLGALLEQNPGLRRLGEDGCLPPAADVETAFPIIRRAVTAWLRNLFGVDDRPLGLLPELDGLTDAYDLTISVIDAK